MWALLALAFAARFGAAPAQQAGEIGDNVEKPPPIALSSCSKAGGCSTEQANLTLDANWRWVYKVQCPGNGQPCYSAGNCFNAGQWDAASCSDPAACASNCAVAGVSAEKYASTYGVLPTPGGVELKFVTGANIGSRLYVSLGESYKMFKLKNREFAFDVDVSGLPCGLNGAAYLVEMPKDGGIGGYNKAGHKFGTGYCDAQCPHDVKFIAGWANVEGWNQQKPFGKMGACCAEMDLWEANSASAAFTPHPCRTEGPLMCQGRDCGDADRDQRYEGVCDKDGCDYNSYRMGEQHFLGKGPAFNVDTSKKFTVVTQFLTSDGTDAGDLTEIRRIYVQDGKAIENSPASVLGGAAGNSLTDAVCSAQKAKFGDPDDFTKKGGLKQMGAAMDRGMVLVLSLWDDTQTSMLWLDSQMGEGGKPGVSRGPCSSGSGQPQEVRAQSGGASVKFSNLMYGELGSTFTAGVAAKPEAAAAVDPYKARLAEFSQASPSVQQQPAQSAPPEQNAWQPAMGLTPSSVCAKEFELCAGGQEWTGPTCCNDGCTCTPKFWSVSQCLPDAGRDSCPAPPPATPEPESDRGVIAYEGPTVGVSNSAGGDTFSSSPLGWAFFGAALLAGGAYVAAPQIKQLLSPGEPAQPGSPLRVGSPSPLRMPRSPGSERQVSVSPVRSPARSRAAQSPGQQQSPAPAAKSPFASWMHIGRSESTVSHCRPDEV